MHTDQRWTVAQLQHIGVLQASVTPRYLRSGEQNEDDGEKMKKDGGSKYP